MALSNELRGLDAFSLTQDSNGAGFQNIVYSYPDKGQHRKKIFP
jgi:hypothetical protein